jgi:hypothetical protein
MKHRLIVALILLSLLITNPGKVFAQQPHPPTPSDDPRTFLENSYWVQPDSSSHLEISKDKSNPPAIPVVDDSSSPVIATRSELVGSTSIVNGDFEQGQYVGWTESSSNGYDVVVPYTPDPVVIPHSGTWIAWLGGADDEITVLSQSNLTIPQYGVVRLWYWSASGDDCGYDYGTVQINSSNVYVWNLCYDTNTYGWVPLQIDVSGYYGQTVTLSIQVTTDVGYSSNLLIDDVSLAIGRDKDSAGVFRPSNGALYLKVSNFSGYADIAINYGIPNDYPVVGDWDGNGTDTIGIFRNGVFYLRNANTIGIADIYFNFGSPGDQPIAGDWNGDGVDTIGLYRPSTFTFYLRNSNTTGAPDATFQLGMPGDVGIAGDWNGDGSDTTGVFRPSNGVIFLKNTNASGYADIGINYGIGGDKPVTGDWDNNGTDTIGVLRGNTFYLRNSNTVGYADMVFDLGIPGDMPIAGDWDALP